MKGHLTVGIRGRIQDPETGEWITVSESEQMPVGEVEVEPIGHGIARVTNPANGETTTCAMESIETDSEKGRTALVVEGNLVSLFENDPIEDFDFDAFDAESRANAQSVGYSRAYGQGFDRVFNKKPSPN